MLFTHRSADHPDKGGDPEKFKTISEAYAVLSDEQKRAAYDRFLDSYAVGNAVLLSVVQHLEKQRPGFQLCADDGCVSRRTSKWRQTAAVSCEPRTNWIQSGAPPGNFAAASARSTCTSSVKSGQ